jgi:ribosomal protein S18 acetylase RimI-like enzyme
VTIRAARSDDADAITNVFLSALSGMTYLPQLYSDEETRTFIEDVLLPNNEVWVAEEGGDVVGFAGFSDGFLRHLWVQRSWQGQGVGTALLKVAMDRCRDGLQLWVFQKNTGARRLYERHGFELAELTNGERNEEHEPDARYVWNPGRQGVKPTNSKLGDEKDVHSK